MEETGSRPTPPIPLHERSRPDERTIDLIPLVVAVVAALVTRWLLGSRRAIERQWESTQLSIGDSRNQVKGNRRGPGKATALDGRDDRLRLGSWSSGGNHYMHK